MAQRTKWLNRASFAGRISLPPNFDLKVFDPYLLDIEETQLVAIVGETRLAELKTWLLTNPFGVVPTPEGEETPAPTNTEKLYALIVPYLVYAAYACFVFEGSAMATDTGIVEKERDSSEGLSDVKTAQLYRSYRDRANARISVIKEFITTLDQASCGPDAFAGELRISSSRGRKGSITDSL